MNTSLSNKKQEQASSTQFPSIYKYYRKII